MFIVQHQFGDSVAVVPPTSSQATVGSSDIPVRLDLGSQFTVYVDVAKNAYSGQILFFYMQDFKTSSGAINGGSYQTTAKNVPSMRLTQIPHPTSPTTLDRYTLTIPEGSYPTLMNSGNSWNSAKDGSIFRPSVYVGHTPDINTQAAWSSSFVVNADVWGVKNLKKIMFPETINNAVIEINQYDAINQDLETMLLAGVPQPGGGTFTLPSASNSTFYTWYMRDQYGVSPYVSTVNNPNAWLNNVYQVNSNNQGFKPWINSTHVDTTNHIYMSQNSKGESCYTLYYYVIPTSRVSSGYADTAAFRQYAYRIAVKIKPAKAPLIPQPVTIAKEDYGSAAAGTTWRSTGLGSQSTLTWSSGKYLPGDGQYTIMQDIVGSIYTSIFTSTRPPDWYVPASGNANDPAKKYDHTSGNGTGFMYVVNADGKNGVFYKTPVTVCANMNLQFSMWLMNMCDGTRSNNSFYSAYRIKPNVRIQIWPDDISKQTSPPSGTPLLDYYTGEIPMTGIWEQYFTPVFNVGNNTTVTVFYLSVPDGGTGNDFMMDDIQIQRSNGAFTFPNTDHITCLGTNTYQLEAGWDTTALRQLYAGNIPASFDYLWTYYANITDPGSITASTPTSPVTTANGSSISGTVAYSPTGKIPLTVPGTQVGTYRLTVKPTTGPGSSGSFDDKCATYSYCVFVPASPPQINTTAVNPVCPGTQINLTIDTTNIPDPSQLQWFTVAPDSTSLNPLLNSDGNQASGAKITVTPFDTTTYAVKLSGCSTQLQYRINVQTGPVIAFGSNLKTTGYVRRVRYDTTAISIPVSYSLGQGTLTYQVYQDGVANATLLASGTVSSANPAGTISFDPSQIRPSLENFMDGLDTITCAVLVKDGSSNTCASVQKFKIRFVAGRNVSVMWAPDRNTTSPDDRTNWNNDANWYIADGLGNRYNQSGIPTDSSHVIIPGDATVYPVLKAGSGYQPGQGNVPGDDGFNPSPRCKSITFQYGGEVGQLQHLKYQYAFVEMNMGTYNNNGFTNTANTINTDGGSYYPYYLLRDRYYSMSAPLKDMYAGDFAFGGKPNVYMKYADAIPIAQDSTAEMINKWTISISSYKVPFTAGFGFAYQVYSGNLDENWPNKKNQKNLNSVSGVIQWPYFMDDAYRDSINPRHAYSAPVSTFTYFSEGRPDSIALHTQPDQVTRKFKTINGVNTPLGNRFIAENDDDIIPAEWPKVPIGTKQKDSEILIGNPFMSHLDFQQFYRKNKDNIGLYYRIWQGIQYYTVAVNTSGGLDATNLPVDEEITSSPGNEMVIAPMQSFFIPISDSATGDIIFDIETMSVTKPDKSVALRSSPPDNDREILKIKAANSRYSATAVIIHKPGKKELSKGVPKLFSPSGNIPEVYLIQDYKKEIIEIDDTPQAIPLEIKTEVTGGVLRLTFTGLENFSSKVALKDTKTGETKKLSATDNVYSFMNNEGDQTNRFFLLFGDYTGINNPTADWISVSARNSRIYVNASSLDPVQSVKIYNLQGQTIAAENNLSVVSYESGPVNGKGVYLVEVKTGLSSVTKKVIVY